MANNPSFLLLKTVQIDTSVFPFTLPGHSIDHQIVHSIISFTPMNSISLQIFDLSVFLSIILQIFDINPTIIPFTFRLILLTSKSDCITTEIQLKSTFHRYGTVSLLDHLWGV